MRIRILFSIPFILMVSTITSEMNKTFGITFFYTFSISFSLDQGLGTETVSIKFAIRYK